MAARGPDPGSADEWLARAVDLAGRGEPAASVDALQKVLAARPDDADALCLLGVAMYDLQRFEEAARCQEQALTLRPAFPAALFNLGLARFEQADERAALAHLRAGFALNRGAEWTPALVAGLKAEPSPPFKDPDMGVNEVKLRHDCEQLEYLLALERLPPDYQAVLAEYRQLLEELRSTGSQSIVAFDAARYPLVARTYKRPVYIADAPAGPLLDARLDAPSLEARYQEARPNVVVVDDLLVPDALAALRRFCRESTIWNNIQTGYLGAYMYDGFSSAPLLRLAAELRERLPGIFRGLPLQMMWGYKYDCTLPGIGVHADAAAVNMNLWLTEDEANLDAERGGLLVYTKIAPRHWDFARFNRDSVAINDYLKSIGSEPLRVPYRANRAVIFDSDLFHATDELNFRPGYANRRINITLLYGLQSS